MISRYRLMIINHSDTDIYNDIDWELPTTWLWSSDPRKDFCRSSLPPIYIAAATTDRNPPPKSSKIPETMNNNKDYRYQLESKKLMGDI